MKHTERKAILINSRTWIVVLIALISIGSSCKKFVEVPVPETLIIRKSVFSDDATATAAMLSTYGQLNGTSTFSGGSIGSISFLQALSSDEMTLNLSSASASTGMKAFLFNNLLESTSEVSATWNLAYKIIYSCNDILEGLEHSTAVTTAVKSQIAGEAKFIRAFTHFYLVNLFADIPYIISTDYLANSVITRLPQDQVYQKIVQDLLDAKQLLIDQYPTSGKVRVNKGAVTAFLARVYLYMGDWSNAEIQSTAVINNTTQYTLGSLDAAFLKNSSETIWSIYPAGPTNKNGFDGQTFIVTASPRWGYIRNELYNSFESTDSRKTKWVSSFIVGGITYRFPYKYKKQPTEVETEYSMVLRLSEQYLIRAEARTQLNNFNGARDDINLIRVRAFSPANPITASDKSSLLTAIEHERRVELFTEWGHRWFDLKRWKRSDIVLSGLSDKSWQSSDTLLPIPESEIMRNPNLFQNPGY